MDQSNKKILGTSLIHDIFEKVVFLMHPTLGSKNSQRATWLSTSPKTRDRGGVSRRGSTAAEMLTYIIL